VAFALAFAVADAARAEPAGQGPDQPRHRPRWDRAWTHHGVWDYSLAGTSALAVVVEGVVLQPIRPPLRWTAPILFDADVRGALRASSASTRNTLEDVSWALWGMQIAYPVLVDVPFAWARGDHQLAVDLFWQDAATLTFAAAVDLGLRDLAGRARPRVYDCLSGGGTHCLDDVESTRSFPGGHIVNSTAASVLACTQHLSMELYGGPWDAVACATTVASDVTLAVLRIVSDNHWATDQIAGMAIGGLIGWGVPYVMHLHGHARSSASGRDGPSVIAVPMPVPLDHGAGLQVTGIF